MPPRRAPDDAFGAALLDWVRGATACEVVERDDGHAEDGAGPWGYLSSAREWPAGERKALRHVHGRVLDVGCGGGRVALELERRGFDVVATDASPLAVRAARTAGVRSTRCVPIEALDRELAAFDTVVLFGNNVGLFGTPTHARRVLTKWSRLVAPGTTILAESTSPYLGGAPVIDRAYYRRNVARGRAPGQVRYRVRYGDLVGAWANWLFVSPRDLRAIVAGTGWQVAEVLTGGRAEPFVAVLELAQGRASRSQASRARTR
jgi:SAM-dependent methyltransferase